MKDRKQWIRKGQNLVTYGPTGVYYGRAKVMGKYVYECLKTNDRKIADSSLLKFMKRIHKARNRALTEKKTALNSKFKDLFSRYGKEVSEDPSLKPNSKKARIHSLIRIEKTWPELLEMKPSRLRKKDVERWIRNLASVGTNFTPPNASTSRTGNSDSAVLKSIQTLSRIMDTAVEDGLATENVVKQASCNRKLLKGKKADEAYIPTWEEFEAIAEELSKGRGGGDREFTFRFLAFTGCRINEAKALIWSDVDFEAQDLYIRGTKTETSDRVLPMHSALTDLLEQRFTALRLIAKSEELEPLNVLRAGNLNKQIARVCKTLGIPRRHKQGQRNRITNHSLRHFFSTNCLMRGVPAPTVSKWLGHKDGGALLFKTYNHESKEKGRKAASHLDFDNRNEAA